MYRRLVEIKLDEIRLIRRMSNGIEQNRLERVSAAKFVFKKISYM